MLYFASRIFVGSLLRHLHSNQVPDAPLTKDSPCVCISLSGTDYRWLDHSLICRVDGLSISLSVSCMKLLNFICFFGTVWLCGGCQVSFTCSSLSLCIATLLLMAGGAIPVSRYKLSILLGCRHPVMERHTSFNTGLTL